MRILKNQDGVSLMEALVTIAAICIVMVTLYDVLTNQKIWESKTNKYLVLQNVMQQNLVEIRARPFAALINGHCIIRVYDTTGTFISESEQTRTCTHTDLVGTETMKVSWNIKQVTDADLTFIGATLPMPKYYDSVKLVAVEGVASSGDDIISLALTSYRR